MAVMGVIGPGTMTVRKGVDIGSMFWRRKGIGTGTAMGGFGAQVTKGGTRSTLSVMTMKGEDGRSQGASQAMVMMMIFQ